MANRTEFLESRTTFNPFEVNCDTITLMYNLDVIDSRSIRTKFKNTQDPINLAFRSLDNAPLKSLAKDFVKESFKDIVSFVSKICK